MLSGRCIFQSYNDMMQWLMKATLSLQGRKIFCHWKSFSRDQNVVTYMQGKRTQSHNIKAFLQATVGRREQLPVKSAELPILQNFRFNIENMIFDEDNSANTFPLFCQAYIAPKMASYIAHATLCTSHQPKVIYSPQPTQRGRPRPYYVSAKQEISTTQLIPMLQCCPHPAILELSDACPRRLYRNARLSNTVAPPGNRTPANGTSGPNRRDHSPSEGLAASRGTCSSGAAGSRCRLSTLRTACSPSAPPGLALKTWRARLVGLEGSELLSSTNTCVEKLLFASNANREAQKTHIYSTCSRTQKYVIYDKITDYYLATTVQICHTANTLCA